VFGIIIPDGIRAKWSEGGTVKVLDTWLKKLIAGCLAMVLAVPAANAATPPQKPVDSQRSQSTSSSTAQVDQSGKSSADGAETYPDSPDVASLQAQATPSTPSQSSPETQQGDAQKPVGTAAAPYEKPTGVAASRPAGAVVAPAKQRRARRILISVGIVVGAAVAVGIVAGLSKSNSGRP